MSLQAQGEAEDLRSRPGDADETGALQEKVSKIGKIKAVLSSAREDQEDLAVLVVQKTVQCALECSDELNKELRRKKNRDDQDDKSDSDASDKDGGGSDGGDGNKSKSGEHYSR